MLNLNLSRDQARIIEQSFLPYMVMLAQTHLQNIDDVSDISDISIFAGSTIPNLSPRWVKGFIILLALSGQRMNRSKRQ